MISAEVVLQLLIDQGHELTQVALDDYTSLERQVPDDEFLVAVHDQGIRKVPVFIQDSEQFKQSFTDYYSGLSLGIKYFSVSKSAVMALVV